MGLLWGGGILAANLAVVGIILLLSEPEDVTKFETAAGATPKPIKARPKRIEVSLPSHPVYVGTLKSSKAIDYVNVHLVIDEASHKKFICNRLPQIKDVLSVSFGGEELAGAGLQAFSAPRMAEIIRHRINHALNVKYVKNVTISFGYQSFKEAAGCSRSEKKTKH